MKIYDAMFHIFVIPSTCMELACHMSKLIDWCMWYMPAFFPYFFYVSSVEKKCKKIKKCILMYNQGNMRLHVDLFINLAKQGYCNHFVCLCVCVCVSVCVSLCPR